MNSENTITTLLVDDDLDAVLILKAALMNSVQQLFRVIHADCLKKGLDILAEGGIDIILLELNLPDSCGLDTLRAVLSHTTGTPIVVMSELANEALALEAMKQGAQDYLEKGVPDDQTVIHVLTRAIGRYHYNHNERSSGFRTHSIVNSSSDGIVVVDGDGVIKFVNPAAESLFGRSAGQLIGAIFGFPILAETSVEIEILHPGSEIKVVEMRTTEISWNRKPAFLASMRDITERSAQLRKAKTESLTDGLTGLYNRRAFFNIANHHLKLLNRNQSCLSLVYLDLDDLKLINDLYGHQNGDQALLATATILNNTFRETDIIARLGGDEFGVLAVDTTKDAVEILTARLEVEINTYNQLKKHPFPISISWGSSVALPSQSITLEEHLNLADSQMYTQKAGKKDLTQ